MSIHHGRTVRTIKLPTLRSLRAEAAKQTNALGHNMRWSVIHSELRTIHRGVCTRCEAMADCELKPLRVAGEALEYKCDAHTFRPGELVWWKDPDAGLCSAVVSVLETRGAVIKCMKDGGSTVYAYAKELSRRAPK